MIHKKLGFYLFPLMVLLFVFTTNASAACRPDDIIVGDLNTISITDKDFTFSIDVMDGAEEYTYTLPKSNPLYYKANHIKDEYEKAISSGQIMKLIVCISADEICEIFKATSDAGKINSYVKRDDRYIIKFNVAETSIVYNVYITSTNPLFYNNAESLLKELQSVDFNKNEVCITVNENNELFEYWVQAIE